MKTDDPKYIPALNVRSLTSLYDPLLKWIMKEERFKQHLIRQAGIQPGYRVLDLGCGTWTLTVMIKQAVANADVIGLDGDYDVLAIARAKAEQAGTETRFDFGLASELPYEDEFYNRVFSSLVIHHLTTDDKRKAIKEVFRVLAGDSEFHLVDFGKPKTVYNRIILQFMRHLERIDDNVKGLTPEFLKQAGFLNVRETISFTTLFGSLSILMASKN